MMFAMMFFYVWGEDTKVSSINQETVTFMSHLLHLQNAAWEVTRMSGSTYFRDLLSK